MAFPNPDELVKMVQKKKADDEAAENEAIKKHMSDIEEDIRSEAKSGKTFYNGRLPVGMSHEKFKKAIEALNYDSNAQLRENLFIINVNSAGQYTITWGK